MFGNSCVAMSCVKQRRKRWTIKIKIVPQLRRGHFGVILNAIRKMSYSDSLSFGLRRDLTTPFETPSASIPLIVRPLVDGDISALLNMDAADITSEGINERWQRLQLLKADIPTCYVAVTPSHAPCCMQWLIMPSENDNVQSYFGGLFPRLAPDEALLEGAFTSETHRGQRIMSCAMAQIAKKAEDFGARWAITFVSHDNIPSLKGCKRAGFIPFLIRKEKWRLFRRRVTFTPLPAGTAYPLDVEQATGKRRVNSLN